MGRLEDFKKRQAEGDGAMRVQQNQRFEMIRDNVSKLEQILTDITTVSVDM